jgi:hypothetical protein
MMLAKIESWEQKKNIFNSFSVECPYLLSKLLIKVPAFNCRRCEVFELRSARTNVLLMSPLYQMLTAVQPKLTPIKSTYSLQDPLNLGLS